MKSFQSYPEELERAEAHALRQRRAIISAGTEPGGPVPDSNAAPAPPPSTSGVSADDTAKLPKDALGFGFSGGGIRSATFCLGVAQAFAQRGWLRHFDFLSTVSGGGYAGAFLGRFYDRLRPSPNLAADIVESAVSNSASAPIRWLRNHGQYIAPRGKQDLQIGAAIYVRNVLTLQIVVGLMVFGIYGLANALRYVLLERVAWLLPLVNGMTWANFPLGHLVTSMNLDVLWSPWFVIVELLLLFRCLPLALGYWLASQDEDEAYNRAALAVTTVTVFVLLYLGVGGTGGGALNVPFIGGALALMASFLSVERTWHHVRDDKAAMGSGGARIQQLRARTRLSADLGVWIAITATLLYLALIDTFGRALYEGYGRGNVEFSRTLAWLSGAFVTALPLFRAAGRLIAEARSRPGQAGTSRGLLDRPAVNAVLVLLLLVPPLLAVSFLSHASFGGGSDEGIWRGVWTTVFALVISFIIALPWAVTLVNRSSLQATYAARLARAYLGASNPLRQGRSIDDVLPGDDVDALPHYRPHEAGGPLHLVNVCINQTIDENSLRSARDRHAIAMACSPVGVSIGKFFHALWNPEYVPGPLHRLTRRRKASAPAPAAVSAAAKSTLAQLSPPLSPDEPYRVVGHLRGTAHPLLRADGKPSDTPEILPVRDWIAISGAAFGPGMGRGTNAALAILFLLGNLRIGYWWDSGLTAGERGAEPRVSFVRRLLWLLPRLFATQTRLIAEALAQFRGPWDRLWYLSDGGHFEMFGGYELVRRRVPFIVVLDGGGGDFADFANFQRLVRIDFHAEVLPLGKKAWDEAVNKRLQQHPQEQQKWDEIAKHVSVELKDGGPFDILYDKAQRRLDAPVTKHAALFTIDYGQGRRSTVLYIIASLSGDEPVDVVGYHAMHSEFPNESTTDQFFDEAQWESYRCLGEHIGDVVLGPGQPSSRPNPEDFWFVQLFKG